MKYMHSIPWMAFALVLACSPQVRGDTGTEMEAYLGVVSSSVQPPMAKHLKLTEGVGLMVDYVDPESAAGDVLEKHDILEQFEDQLLVSPHQLAVLTRSRKPGDSIQLTVIRGGERKKVRAKLGKREAGAASPIHFEAPRIEFTVPGPQPFGHMMQHMPDADAIREQIQSRVMPQLEREWESLQQSMPDWDVFQERMDEAMKSLDVAHPIFDAPRATGAGHQHQTSIIVKDGLNVTWTREGDQEHLKALRGDDVLFDGPVTTEQDREALPDEVKELYDQLRTVTAEPQPVVL